MGARDHCRAPSAAKVTASKYNALQVSTRGCPSAFGGSVDDPPPSTRTSALDHRDIYGATLGAGRSRWMTAKLTFRYDRDSDILYIDKCLPYPQQESEELGDDVIARLNPNSGEIETLQVLFFSTRRLRGDLFEVPVTAELRPAVPAGPAASG
jgi:hypothetical protein